MTISHSGSLFCGHPVYGAYNVFGYRGA